MNLIIQKAMENEDKKSLEAVEDGEQVSHKNGAVVDVQKPKHPG